MPSVLCVAVLAPKQVERPSRGEAKAALGSTAVVVGHDGSAGAAAVLAHAARRAGPGGYLVVVHALPRDEGRSGYVRVVGSVLRSIESALPAGQSYETRVVAGSASKALLEVARRYDASEIVVGAGTGAGAGVALGRVSRSVLRDADRPVTIVAGVG